MTVISRKAAEELRICFALCSGHPMIGCPKKLHPFKERAAHVHELQRLSQSVLKPRKPAPLPREKWPGFGSCHLASAMDTGQGDFKWQEGVGTGPVHCMMTGTGPSAAVITPTWRVQTSRDRAVHPATYIQLPLLPPEAQGSLSHLLRVRDSWAALQLKGLPPRKASSSPLHTSNITVDNTLEILTAYCQTPCSTSLHSWAPSGSIPIADEETKAVCR